ncbi:MAG: polyvinylalcohol dehydrogenase, partial [Verrucomicrobia bacterium]|nr:polyvinylalcohol dehydrogenase [Verrucomicrobiota bacterium]
MTARILESVRMLFLFSMLTSATCVCAADWPCWQGSNRDARSADTGLLKEWPAGGPTQVWKVSDLGKGFTSVAVSKDVIYTTGDVGEDLTIYAYDSKGVQKWKAVQGPAFTRKGNYPGSRSTPAIDNGKLYVLGGLGLLACHDITADGKQLWKRDLVKEFGGGVPNWGYTESPLILDNMVIVTPGGKTAIIALDKNTGKEIWQSDAQAGANYSSAIVIKEKDAAIIAQGTGDGIFVVDAKDGKKIWSNPFSAKNTANAATPAYADGFLFWANGYGKGGRCFKVEHKDGKWNITDAWPTKDMVCHHGGYIIEKGYIYGNHNNGWSCIELASGTTKWTQPGVGKGSICFADGMLYMYNE